MISPERKAAYDRLYYAANKARKQAQAKAWNEKNRADQCAKKRARYRAKRSEILEYFKTPAMRERGRMNSKNQKAKRRMAKATYAPMRYGQWRDIKASYLGMCVYCQERPATLTMDHIVPLSAGGAHEPDNIVPACGPCNSTKHKRSLLEFLRVRIMEAAHV